MDLTIIHVFGSVTAKGASCCESDEPHARSAVDTHRDCHNLVSRTIHF
jgi:hypothetical protein